MYTQKWTKIRYYTFVHIVTIRSRFYKYTTVNLGSQIPYHRSEALYSVYKKWLHAVQMTNDRQIHRLNYQWQACIHFNWPIFQRIPVTEIFTVHHLTTQHFTWTTNSLKYTRANKYSSLNRKKCHQDNPFTKLLIE